MVAHGYGAEGAGACAGSQSDAADGTDLRAAVEEHGCPAVVDAGIHELRIGFGNAIATTGIGEFGFLNLDLHAHDGSNLQGNIGSPRNAHVGSLLPGNNGNRSRIHWDLVLIQRPDYGGGEVYFDGELLRKDGRFVPDDLQGLNIGLNEGL